MTKPKGLHLGVFGNLQRVVDLDPEVISRCSPAYVPRDIGWTISRAGLCPAGTQSTNERERAAVDIVGRTAGAVQRRKELLVRAKQPGLPLGGVFFPTRSKMLSLQAKVPAKEDCNVSR